ncbi:MAG: ATP phosphoribosyltransferase [bacterium (Candidatus Ratteibacteria) CG_4_10_14_3_um_filter_41_18]|uniref:ATP phosphoribosyltransferase n=4 Tax=Candidatus Ratteibacteria TaxID=2979319 RepID=A0A2M7E7D5_9BACT|nr:MAG: ATP phosphoribosyltransferase [bacterium (Candidatus Ratteibacteria) CG01_land_8_20_14_3_00_40_19]PIW31163.1 MAG: ATP phosphoribosyltransferase [bacterium (Candidatus Ratteibacteria) CG15_BIG_FIL_POST_REV_8_21_14_020_41_12]PIX77592.1 MAG: ATP phosphoribosyltransferase [bacterium (Candidatus Ratteibacteria) CG_4_10_14_3_um_filter_41_18]PJA61371.1 MAG: ATP phosphoribosyltransferase [bacterium (Candidatus Ratteibacteria) CG_4_9_14_3_um_filter_41_21]HCG76501.1 ATP phosphoribosyltransferase 
MKKLKIALPKGSLQDFTFSLFKRAGFRLKVEERSYLVSTNDPELEVSLIRAQEIPTYVEKGAVDSGISGKDWILENKARVKEVKELPYTKQGIGSVKLVIAVPKNSPIKKVSDLEGKTIATELVNVTKDYLKKKGVSAKVEFSWGATEIKAGRLVDAIAELTETGATLIAHNLKIIETILTSTPRLIANTKSFREPWKRKKLSALALLLEGALLAETKVGLKLNILSGRLKKLLSVLPALRKPTVSSLSEEGWCAVEAIVEKEEVKNLIPRLKEIGAEGIIEYPLNKVIY